MIARHRPSGIFVGLLSCVAMSTALAQAPAASVPSAQTPAELGGKPSAQKATAEKTTTEKTAAGKTATGGTSTTHPSTYTVAKGDTLFRIAGKIRPQGATLHQTVLALYRDNPDAFLDANINQLMLGRVLKLPSVEAATAVDAAQAAREVRALVTKPSVSKPAAAPPPSPPPMEVKPAPAPKPKPEPPKPAKPAKPAAKVPLLSLAQATERFELGASLERSGNLKAALQAYLDAGNSGHGAAQKRLGDLYNTGSDVVRRDYQTALKWYQKAREQGIEIPKPLTYPATSPPR